MADQNHDDWMIHVNDEENPWIIQVNDQLKQLSCNTNPPMEELEKNRWEKKSIYKLPESFKNHNKKSSRAYTPQVVSIGPYHYKDEHLKGMEEHKDRAVLHFLKRSNQPLQQYFRSLALVVEELKEAYDSLDLDLQRDSDELLRIMIRDGVFLLEIMRLSVKNNVEGYASNDPIFSEHGKLYVTPLIRRDMLMLENQLPMLVLHKLLALENGLKQEDQELTTNKLVFKFFFPKIHIKPPSNCLHVLDMYRKSLLEPKPEQITTSTTTTIPPGAIRKGVDDIIRSAVELTEAGITIKRTRNNGKYLTNKKFLDNGVLELPMIVVDDITEPLFLNLIAFEKFHVGAGNEVSGYIFFMNNIINNAQDVKLLGSKNIIQNLIGSDKAAAELFNSLAVDVIIDQECRFRTLCMDINEYCKKRWPRYRANLIETYFRSPWALLSVIAAIFLFALTIQQSVYTALDYHTK